MASCSLSFAKNNDALGLLSLANPPQPPFRRLLHNPFTWFSVHFYLGSLKLIHVGRNSLHPV